MEPISVVCAGSLFPRAGEFRVHSVFPSAVNLLGADPHPVALLLSFGHRHPRGAVLDLGPSDLTRWGLSAGDAAVFSNEKLRFLRAGVPEVDLTRASALAETIERAEVSGAALSAALSALAGWQLRMGTRLHVGHLQSPVSALTRRFSQAFRVLPDQFEEGARLLVGLGDGLTPSGDDALVGWLAAARVCGRTLPSLHGLATATNAIAAAFLDAAERGLFPAVLVELAAALARPERLPEVFESLAAVGHSSGLDAATGFLVGIQELSARRNP